MKNLRLTGGDAHAHKKRSRTAKQHILEHDKSKYTDPLIGWHSLGKASRAMRQSKHGWRRKTDGMSRGDLLALLFVLAMALFMLLEAS